ncbi:MAG TPA: chloride channel protein [Rhizomicrobium sp.]|nr:chloride channel protein [Rhizomicrobium sp.]
MSKPPIAAFQDHLGDFTASPRLLMLAGMAAIAGFGGTVAAWLLLKLIALCTNLAYYQTVSTVMRDFPAHLPAWTIAIPVAGGLIIGLMARYGSEKIRGHGIPEAIEAILIGQSKVAPKVAILKPLSSAISIGTGGPFGAEGPIIMTGGALGSLFAQLFHLSSAERKTLLVAGAAAGMTAIFNTPIAAVLLAVELLLFEWKPRSFVPVVVASVVAALFRPFLIGSGALFPYAGIPVLPWWGLALCIGVGVLAGLQSAAMTLLLYGIEDAFLRLPIHWMWWPALGGIAVGIGGYFDPAALGVGYDNIRMLLAGNLDMHAATMLLLLKMAIWLIALSSGTSGGVLAPLLIMGGALGAVEGHFIPFADAGFWALLGMSAILGGTMRAPLTATFFAVELTGNTHILLPLLVATVAAFTVTVLLMKRSILTERIARRGLHLTREYSVDPFLNTRVADIMLRTVDTLPATMKVREAVRFYSGDIPRHKSYPVVDDKGRVLAMISRAAALSWAGDPEAQDQTLAEALDSAALLNGYEDEIVGALADRMIARDVGRVPILSRAGNRLVGLVSRRDLLKVRASLSHEETSRSQGFA